MPIIGTCSSCYLCQEKKNYIDRKINCCVRSKILKSSIINICLVVGIKRKKIRKYKLLWNVCINVKDFEKEKRNSCLSRNVG